MTTTDQTNQQQHGYLNESDRAYEDHGRDGVDEQRVDHMKDLLAEENGAQKV